MQQWRVSLACSWEGFSLASELGLLIKCIYELTCFCGYQSEFLDITLLGYFLSLPFSSFLSAYRGAVNTSAGIFHPMKNLHHLSFIPSVGVPLKSSI